MPGGKPAWFIRASQGRSLVRRQERAVRARRLLTCLTTTQRTRPRRASPARSRREEATSLPALGRSRVGWFAATSRRVRPCAVPGRRSGVPGGLCRADPSGHSLACRGLGPEQAVPILRERGMDRQPGGPTGYQADNAVPNDGVSGPCAPRGLHQLRQHGADQ